MPDKPIISALKLPPLYLISPEPGPNFTAFLETLETCIEAGVRLFQLRAKAMPEPDFRSLARDVLRICNAYNVYLMVNTSPAGAVSLGAHGVHLTSHRLRQLSERPLGKQYWVAASCHNAMEVERASRIGVDFVVLSPVYETASHLDTKPLGWNGFERWVARSKVPVYALGGLNPSHMPLALRHGGQGIAMVSGIWNAIDPVAAVQRAYSLVASTCLSGQ